MDKWLTITVPAYNAQSYLYRCLHSIAKCVQYLDRMEVLIVDDGSTDRTREIAAQFAEAYPDSFYLISKENGGHGSAVNVGLRYAHGRYFIVLDADDWLDFQALGELAETIGTGESGNVDLISYHYDRLDMVTGKRVSVRQNHVDYHRIYTFDELPVSDIYFALASSCYRTELLKSMGLKLQEHTFYVDVEYMLLPLPYVETVYFLDLYLYKYFVGNAQQSICLANMVRRYEHHNRVMHRVIDTLLYEGTEKLNGRKEEYALRILEKLLYTHYAILLIYDSNHVQGAEKAKAFDAYLKHASPWLYRRTNKVVPFLRVYRKYDFSVCRVRKAYGYKIYVKCLEKFKNICARALSVWNKRN